MGAVLFVLALAAASTPVVAAVLVSVASRHEERKWSLARTAPGWVAGVARKIVDFHSEGTYPRSRSHSQAPFPAQSARVPVGGELEQEEPSPLIMAELAGAWHRESLAPSQPHR